MVERTPVRALTVLVALILLGGCYPGRNYREPAGPRYAGGSAPYADRAAVGPDTLRVASFNVEFGEEIDSALVVLRDNRSLGEADVLLLQEMDEAGTRRIAEALGMAWVYYPAMWRPEQGRDFGNAVLSRWPIVEDAKLILPHNSIFGGTQRIATRATIRVGSMDVRVYSIHLATPVNQSLQDRQDQLAAVLRDAAAYPHVVIGGDFNSGGLARMAVARGYFWPTEDGPSTVTVGRFDHVVFKGLTPPDSGASGTVENIHHASDHKAIWAVGILR